MAGPSFKLYRYAAFSASHDGGNPAGVVLAAEGFDDATMQHIAADVGYSETAFLTGRDMSGSGATGGGTIRVRYFSPEAEVAFCGHATIATGIALGEVEGVGAFRLMTNAGSVVLTVSRISEGSGAMTATFESPPASAEALPGEHLDRLLSTLGWSRMDLDPRFPPMIATAGNRHPVLVASHIDRLAELSYDFDALARLCGEQDWTTIQLVAPRDDRRWRSRNPFPVGGVIEDPATGAAAAAFGGYLRTLGKAQVGDRFVIEQGIEMGRPSTINIEVRADTVLVTGTATAIPA